MSDTETFEVVLPPGFNPAAIASTDETRWVLQGVMFEENMCIATDGRRIIVQEIIGQCPTPLWVTSDAIQAAFEDSIYRLWDPADFETGEVDGEPETAHREVKLRIGRGFVEYQNAQGNDVRVSFEVPDLDYPNWRKVVPECEDLISIKLNAELLSGLVGIMDSHGACELHFNPDHPRRPVIVTRGKDPSRFGLLMPMKSADDREVSHASDHALIRRVRMQGGKS